MDKTLANESRNRADKLTDLAWAFYHGNQMELMYPLLIEAKPPHLATENENSLMGLDSERLLKELKNWQGEPNLKGP